MTTEEHSRGSTDGLGRLITKGAIRFHYATLNVPLDVTAAGGWLPQAILVACKFGGYLRFGVFRVMPPVTPSVRDGMSSIRPCPYLRVPTSRYPKGIVKCSTLLGELFWV
jgi:hypothetical protein